MSEAGAQRVDKKWLHWCEACKTWVAHVNAHGVSENEALLARLRAVEEERDSQGIRPLIRELDQQIDYIGTQNRLSARITELEADAQRLTAERNGLAHTLHLWNQECGGRSPREILAENARLTAENETFSQHNRAWIRENTRLTAEVARLKERHEDTLATLQETAQAAVRAEGEVAQLEALVQTTLTNGTYAMREWEKETQRRIEAETRERALVEALRDLVPLARALWQMVEDSDIGHRALRPETKATIDRIAALTPPPPRLENP